MSLMHSDKKIKAKEIRTVQEPESGYEIIAEYTEGKRFDRKFQQSTCFQRTFVKQRLKDSAITLYHVN